MLCRKGPSHRSQAEIGWQGMPGYPIDYSTYVDVTSC